MYFVIIIVNESWGAFPLKGSGDDLDVFKSLLRTASVDTVRAEIECIKLANEVEQYETERFCGWKNFCISFELVSSGREIYNRVLFLASFTTMCALTDTVFIASVLSDSSNYLLTLHICSPLLHKFPSVRLSRNAPLLLYRQLSVPRRVS